MTNTLHDHLSGYLIAHRPRALPAGAAAAPAVTISRETGAGGSAVARHLATWLEDHQSPDAGSWAVFDQNLVRKALEQHRLPGHLEQYIPEDFVHFVPDTVEDLLGLHPAASELVRRLAETMVALARQGHSILVGRGGNIITSRLPNVLHVRLVASREARVKHVCQLYNFSPDAAAKFIIRTDRARKRFLRQNFGASVEDPERYDLTINTGRIGFDGAAALIGQAVLRRMAAAAAPDEHGEAVRAWAAVTDA